MRLGKRANPLTRCRAFRTINERHAVCNVERVSNGPESSGLLLSHNIHFDSRTPVGRLPGIFRQRDDAASVASSPIGRSLADYADAIGGAA